MVVSFIKAINNRKKFERNKRKNIYREITKVTLYFGKEIIEAIKVDTKYKKWLFQEVFESTDYSLSSTLSQLFIMHENATQIFKSMQGVSTLRNFYIFKNTSKFETVNKCKKIK